jgi:hypothetical protein
LRRDVVGLDEAVSWRVALSGVFEFRLVREALIERETLLRAMPHISWPMRFVLPLRPTCASTAKRRPRGFCPSSCRG